MSGAVDLSPLKQPTTPPPAAASPGGGPVTIVDVTDANFEADVLMRSTQVPVIVDLRASWSEPSQQLTPILEKLAREDGGKWVLAKVDVDASPGIVQAFGARSVPTVVALAGGRPLTNFSGPQPEDALRAWIDSILNATAGKLAGPPPAEGEEPPADPRFVAAETALDNGDLAAATAEYEKILAAEPGNTQAKAALRQVSFIARAEGLPADAVALADAAPEDIDAQFAAADAELLGGDAPAAFDRLIAGVKRTAGDDRTRFRTRLLELFELFDPADDQVKAARRKLASALY
jgi:putative thioredoxin